MVASPDAYIELRQYHPWRRTVVFLVTFIVCATASLAYVYSQPGLYRATSRLLTLPGQTLQTVDDAGRQPLGQKPTTYGRSEEQTLVSLPVLREAVLRLQRTGSMPQFGQDPVRAVQRLLQVRALGGTHVIEISAQGTDPIFLERLVNSVIESYRDRTARFYEQQISGEYDSLQHTASNFPDPPAQAETNPVTPREANVPVLPEVQQSVVAELQKLTQAYTSSVQNLAKAQAHLQALKKMICAGLPVDGIKDDQAVPALEQRASTLRDQLADLRGRFTREYLSLDAETRALPERIADLDRQIAAHRTADQTAAIVAAEEAVQANQLELDNFRTELAAHQKVADDVTARIAQYTAMQKEVDRPAQTNVNHDEQIERLASDHLGNPKSAIRIRLPQVEALQPTGRSVLLGPDYTRDASLAVGASFGFGLIAALLVGLFAGPPALAWSKPGNRNWWSRTPVLAARSHHSQLLEVNLVVARLPPPIPSP